jgi:chloramphenicol O-acetyltransferase type A
MMKKVDLDNFDRVEQFYFFKNLDVPRYLMTFNLDVTKLYSFVKLNNYSFYYAMIYYSIEIMNQIKNFKYRFYNGEVYELDMLHPSFTDSIENSENFKIVNVLLEDEIHDFIKNAKQKSKMQGKTFINLEEEKRMDLVYITTFPWKSYLQVSHAHNIDQFDAVPRLAWGKFEEISGKLIMPFSIEVHHAFVDGYHVGKYINLLQDKLNSL